VKITLARFRRILWILIVGSLFFDGICLALEKNRRGAPSVEESPLPEATTEISVDGPRLTPEPSEHDFGTVSQKSSLEHVFLLKNTGNAPLEILSVETSCGCTSTLLSEKTIAPGETGELKVGFESGSMEGPFRKKVMVNTNGPESSTKLQIKGSVQPLFLVDPSMLSFGQVSIGQEYRRIVVIQPRQPGTPFKMGRVRAMDPQIRIENERPLDSGVGGIFEVVLTPREDGWEQGSISYETGHPEMPRGYLRYSARRNQ